MTKISRVNYSQGAGAGSGGELTPKADQQKKDPSSIWSDKNNNGIVDKNDFSDKRMVRLAQEKGLLGRSWDSVKDTIGNLMTRDYEEEGVTSEFRFDKNTRESYVVDIKDGREIRKTFLDGTANGGGVVNFYYDKNGKVVREVYTDAKGNLQKAYNIKNNEIVSVNSFYDEDGTIKEETKYAKGRPVQTIYYNDDFKQIIEYDKAGEAKTAYRDKYKRSEYNDKEKNVKVIEYNNRKGDLAEKTEYRNGKAINSTLYKDGYTQYEEYDQKGKVVSEKVTYTGEIPKYDGINNGNIAKFINTASGKLPADSEAGLDELDRVLKEPFGENFDSKERIVHRGGVEHRILLKDGTKISWFYGLIQDDANSMKSDVTITKPDGTKEKYSPEGEKL